MKYTLDDMQETMQSFAESRIQAASCEMEVVGGMNETNPLALLRIYEIQPPTIDSLVQLATIFLNNREVVFSSKGTEVFRFKYEGQDLGEVFKPHPELLDPCLKNCYNVLLKKLTASSTSSVTGDTK